MTYNRYDVVKVPFPFTDQLTHKTRPALVLSDEKVFNTCIGHCVLAMITTAKHSSWPLDTLITDLASAGLPATSIIRLKLFTLDERLILTRLGKLAMADKTIFEQNLKQLFNF